MAKFKGSTFQVGDVVEITAEAASTGMLDFVEGKAYRVEDVDYNAKEWCAHNLILLKDESGLSMWYNAKHFKLKENTVESNENHFKVGQTVWDVLYGKGVVTDVNSAYQNYPVRVKFPDGTRSYTVEGKLDKELARTLFFSEPKIEAATEPVFVPTLKAGYIVVAMDECDPPEVIVVSGENEYQVKNNKGTYYHKHHYDFYKLGEKIEFN